jgi:predicted deacylase
MKRITVGDVKAVRGKIVRGRFPLLELPTGVKDFLAVVILQGKKPGPCLWLTANIHGDENTGLVALHRFLTPSLVKKLRGTIVAIPALCPANLLARTRNSYYVGCDPYTGANPNRLFPDFRFERKLTVRDPRSVPNVLELAYARLFECVKETADVLVDLHNSWMGTIPFTMEGRIYYENPSRRKRAERLSKKTRSLMEAVGFPIVRGELPHETISRGMFRGISYASLNAAGIPSTALELGTYGIIPPRDLEASRLALNNILVWAKMLDGEIVPIDNIPKVDLPWPVLATETPHSPGPGVLDFQVVPGDVVKKGGVVAILRDVWGRKKATIRAEHDGWIMGTINDVRAYTNKPIAITGIRDRTPAVVPFKSRTVIRQHT